MAKLKMTYVSCAYIDSGNPSANHAGSAQVGINSSGIETAALFFFKTTENISKKAITSVKFSVKTTKQDVWNGVDYTYKMLGWHLDCTATIYSCSGDLSKQVTYSNYRSKMEYIDSTEDRDLKFSGTYTFESEDMESEIGSKWLCVVVRNASSWTLSGSGHKTAFLASPSLTINYSNIYVEAIFGNTGEMDRHTPNVITWRDELSVDYSNTVRATGHTVYVRRTGSNVDLYRTTITDGSGWTHTVTIPANTMQLGSNDIYVESVTNDGVTRTDKRTVSVIEAKPRAEVIYPKDGIAILDINDVQILWVYSSEVLYKRQRSATVKVKNGDTETTFTVSGGDENLKIPANTLQNGVYTYIVTVTNEDGTSYTTGAEKFTIVSTTTSVPTVNKIFMMNDGRYKVSWSADDQLAYEVELLSGSFSWSSGIVFSTEQELLLENIPIYPVDISDTAAHNLNLSIQNVIVLCRVRVFGSNGIVSDWGTCITGENVDPVVLDVTVGVKYRKLIIRPSIEGNRIRIGSEMYSTYESEVDPDWINGGYVLLRQDSRGWNVVNVEGMTYDEVYDNDFIPNEKTEYMALRVLRTGIDFLPPSFFDEYDPTVQILHIEDFAENGWARRPYAEASTQRSIVTPHMDGCEISAGELKVRLYKSEDVFFRIQKKDSVTRSLVQCLGRKRPVVELSEWESSTRTFRAYASEEDEMKIREMIKKGGRVTYRADGDYFDADMEVTDEESYMNDGRLMSFTITRIDEEDT